MEDVTGTPRVTSGFAGTGTERPVAIVGWVVSGRAIGSSLGFTSTLAEVVIVDVRWRFLGLVMISGGGEA